jgi:phenylacetate-coenzyme A ligase PaaK-like adenylate-forming protein
LRFAVGDLAAISHEPCPHCGRTGSARLVAGPVRSGDVIKVKGILVNMSGVCDGLAELAGVRDFQIVLDRRGDRDVLTVRVVTDGYPDAAGARVAELVQRTAHVTPEVVFVDGDELMRGVEGGKVARVVDRRPKD